MKSLMLAGLLLTTQLATAADPAPPTSSPATLESCVYDLAKAMFSVEAKSLDGQREPQIEYAAVVLSSAMVCVESRHLDAQSTLSQDAKQALFTDTVKRALKDAFEDPK